MGEEWACWVIGHEQGLFFLRRVKLSKKKEGLDWVEHAGLARLFETKEEAERTRLELDVPDSFVAKTYVDEQGSLCVIRESN